MATPCGGIDLGVLLHIMTEKSLAPDVFSDLLHNQCGLLGMSGLVAICTQRKLLICLSIERCAKLVR